MEYQERYLTRAQVASLLGVSPHTVGRWAKEGRLPAVLTLGGQRRYPRKAIEELCRQLFSGANRKFQEGRLKRVTP
jgi:excisionase family DNA binding protein